jgi:biopolymer transport protein ExbB/TolQ
MNRTYLLFLRFIVLNIAALAMIVYVWMRGWVSEMVERDVTQISLLIIGVFICGWLICTWKILRCSQEMNAIAKTGIGTLARSQWYAELIDQASGDSRTAIAECLRSRLYSRISVVRLIANNLIILGLIGTVIGFIISLGGVDAERVADVASVAPMVSTLIQGMSVALYTTLVGAVLHVWLMMCYQVLAMGTVNLVNAIIEQSEMTRVSEQREII